MAEAKGAALRRREFSADSFKEAAIFLGSFQVKTPPSKSKAIEVLVTLADQFFFTN